jgi:hypothetical protein
MVFSFDLLYLFIMQQKNILSWKYLFMQQENLYCYVG